MPQHDMNIANDTAANVRSDLNNALAALVGVSSGASAPGTTFAYMLWADTSNGLLKQRNAANSGWIIRGTLAESIVTSKSAAYSVVITDCGRVFSATGTWSLSLLAAATAGDGFHFWLRNDGTGNITIDPNSTEQVDGATTVVVYPGESCMVVCSGSAWTTIGRRTSPKFSAGRSANQTGIATGTFTKVQFDSEAFDIGAAYDPTTNYRYTPQVAGKYLVMASVDWVSSVDQSPHQTLIYKNGSAALFGEARSSGTGALAVQCIGVVDMNGSTDYLECYCYQGSGSNKDVLAGASTYFQAALLP